MSRARDTGVAIGLSLLAALFFTATYVFNRAIAIDGGHWAWTASLRYIFMLPLLLPMLPRGVGAGPVLREMRVAPLPWLAWSGIGFVLFYTLLSFAAASGPSWLVAGTFQVTVVAGMLCAPLLYRDGRRRIPPVALLVGTVIVAGVLVMQWAQAGGALDGRAWLAIGCVLLSAFAYPLGNRGLLLHLERRGARLNAGERVFGLTLASQPAWWLLAAWGWRQAGPPSAMQLLLTLAVAVLSGVVATVLFFAASARVQHDPVVGLGAVEAMQASEVVLAALVGAAFFGEALPRGSALAGMAVVIAGIAVFSLLATRRGPPEPVVPPQV